MKTLILKLCPVFIFSIGFALAGVQSANGATFTVTNTNDSGVGSLRQAILDSNATSGADVITFNIPATDPNCNATSHVCTITPLTVLADLADDVTIDGLTQPGSTPFALLVTVSAATQFRIFTIDSGKTVMISGLTISGGNANGTSFPDNAGGGIFNRGTLTISNCTISGNSAAVGGGGIANDGHTSSASVTLSNSSVSGNSAVIGGGIYTVGTNATVTVTNCTINGNTANTNSTQGSSGMGGGIFNDGSLANTPGATLTVSNSTLSGNSAPSQDGEGGAIYNDGEGGHASATVKNCTLSGNSAGFIGGGIVNQSVGNAGPRAVLTIGSTILNAGTSGANIVNQNGVIPTSLGYNLSSDAAGGDGTTVPGGFLNNTGDIRNTNPMLAALANNGGPTFTHAINCSSPAADHGKNFDSLTTDQRGTNFARTVGVAAAQGGDGTDIGAFEFQTVCNEPPVAVGDSYSTDENTPLTVAAPGVLANDSDPNGDTITAVLVSGPSHGTLTLNADGSFNYTPARNFNGGDSFTYKARDSHNADSNIVTVNITVNHVDQPPTFSSVATISRKQHAAASNSQIATVSDVDNPAGGLTVTVMSAPTGITVSNIVNTNGTITADVAADCSAALGMNAVVLQVSDGQLSATGNLTVNVTASNPPVITLQPAAILQPNVNHSYHTFAITQMVQSATDDCGGNVINNIVIEKATSDETEHGPGIGTDNTLKDIVIASDCKSVQLRAERDGTSDGRVYLVTLRVSDSSGNVVRAVYTVSVPVGKAAAVDSGVHYTVLSSCQL